MIFMLKGLLTTRITIDYTCRICDYDKLLHIVEIKKMRHTMNLLWFLLKGNIESLNIGDVSIHNVAKNLQFTTHL